NDGSRGLVFASRGTKKVQLLNAADGAVKWSIDLPGACQSVSAYDVDGDGRFEILYSTSSPGRLYLLNSENGAILRQMAYGDNKLGNAPVILDGDGDGVLDVYMGSRSGKLLRINLQDFTIVNSRSGWPQCG